MKNKSKKITICNRLIKRVKTQNLITLSMVDSVDRTKRAIGLPFGFASAKLTFLSGGLEDDATKEGFEDIKPSVVDGGGDS